VRGRGRGRRGLRAGGGGPADERRAGGGTTLQGLEAEQSKEAGKGGRKLALGLSPETRRHAL
jgi:hypothetical protein